MPLIDDEKDAAVELVTEEVHDFEREFKNIWLNPMRRKIGLNTEEEGNFELIQMLLNAMQEGEADFTSPLGGYRRQCLEIEPALEFYLVTPRHMIYGRLNGCPGYRMRGLSREGVWQ